MIIRRGIIREFDSSTYLADVQIVGSMATMLTQVPVAKQIGAGLLTSGSRCGVLFFDETNPSDACVAFVYDGAPGAWITSALIKDGEIVEADLAFDPAVVDSGETISADWLFSGAYKLQFRDSDIYIHSAADGYLDLVADTAIRLAGTALYVDVVNDRVGIGTATPDTALHFFSSQQWRAAAKIEGTYNGSNSARILLKRTLDGAALPNWSPIGKLMFVANNLNAEEIEFGGIWGATVSSIDGAESGYISFHTAVSGVDTELLFMRGAIAWINSANLDMDFRVDGVADYSLFIEGSSGYVGLGKVPSYLLDLNLATEDFAIEDAGSAGATEQDWVKVRVGGNIGYLRVFAAA